VRVLGTVDHGPEEGRGGPRLGLRSSLAARAVVAANRVVRSARFGQGTVVGGRVGLAIAPDLLRTLSMDRSVALVSGTNGKTTTTRLLAAALGTPGAPGLSSIPPASNVTGANMPEGHVAALCERWSPTAVLEVDESYLGQLVVATDPAVVVLLNLSRDQLDRIAEVRLVAERWRTALDRRNAGGGGGGGVTVVVANADDPLVVWAAEVAPAVVWVGVGQVWDEDSVGCPRCGASLLRAAGKGWRCARCSFARPTPSVWTDGRVLVQEGGVRTAIDLALPGGFNVANAAMAAVGAAVLCEPGAATDRHLQHHIGATVRRFPHPQGAVELRCHQGPHDLQAQAVGFLEIESFG